MVSRSFLTRALGLAGAAALLAACSSTPPPKPAEPPPPPPPPAEPPPPPPKLPLLFVSPIRSVDTPRVPRVVVQELSRRLSDQIGGSGRYAIAGTGTSTTASAGTESCVVESCELAAARRAAAESVLHTRLIQYSEQCVLLSVLYDAESQRNRWAHTRAFACDAAAVEGALTELGAAFLAREEVTPSGPIYAVAPIQHDLADIAWASESYAEYLTTLLAAAGKSVVPASNVSGPLEGKSREPYRGCPDKACAIELGRAASADVSVASKVIKKKNACTLDVTAYAVATKTSTGTASAKGGCTAAELAEEVRAAATKLIGDAPATSDLR